MKKQLEKIILRNVYSDSIYNIIEEEEPDFILANPKSNIKFGVEITDLYWSESNARLKNIPNYTIELLNKQPYRHKDDFINIKIDTVKFKNPNNNEEFETIAVIQEFPPIDVFLDAFIKSLEKKESKFPRYIEKPINHVNLIINENGNYFNLISIKEFYKTFFTPDIIKKLIKTPFREIFLLTQIEEEKYYIYLKSIYFLSVFWSMREFAIEINDDFVYENFVLIFLQYCHNIEIKDIFYTISNSSITIYYSDLMILINGGETIISRSYEVDYSFLNAYNKLIDSFSVPEEIYKNFESYKIGKVFATEWFAKVE